MNTMKTLRQARAATQRALDILADMPPRWMPPPLRAEIETAGERLEAARHALNVALGEERPVSAR